MKTADAVPHIPMDIADHPEIDRWAIYEARKAAWLAANPGAYPSEVQHMLRIIAEELGL